VDGADRTVVITGCAHPGIVEMVRGAQAVVPGKISLLLGGFHLGAVDKSQAQSIATELRRLGVERILPTHCTGDVAISVFRSEYADSYVAGGVGRTVLSPAKKQP
jgi:7,8-dihydropterin-6-yl-methyl-4-(beta-D-ribofuranosyl)aminobenzene 5'-phosphate synthase